MASKVQLEKQAAKLRHDVGHWNKWGDIPRSYRAGGDHSRTGLFNAWCRNCYREVGVRGDGHVYKNQLTESCIPTTPAQ